MEALIMKLVQSVYCVDAHTTGTPIRVITGGIPPLRGSSINEKMLYMEKHFDWLRACIACPPRAAQSTVCAVLVPPCNPEADFGVFYMDSKAYQPMCGAGTLSVAKVLFENGFVPRVEPTTKIVLETPSGLVKAFIDVKNGEAVRISFENQPAFLYKKDIVLDVENLGKVTVDIGFGGNFFAIVNTKQLPYPLSLENREQYRGYMRAIVKAVENQVDILHPENPDLNYLNQVLFYVDQPDENGGYTCQCIFGDAELDVSPCGTGTCTRLAQRYIRGLIGLDEEFIQNSLYGSSFYATALKETKVGSLKAIVPKVSCDDVRVIGFNHLVVEADDAHKTGI